MKPQLVYNTVYVNIEIFFHRRVNMGNPYVASKLPCLEKEEPQTNREGGALGPQSFGQAWDSSEMVSGYQNKQ